MQLRMRELQIFGLRSVSVVLSASIRTRVLLPAPGSLIETCWVSCIRSCGSSFRPRETEEKQREREEEEEEKR